MAARDCSSNLSAGPPGEPNYPTLRGLFAVAVLRPRLSERAPLLEGFDAVKHLVLCRIERRPPRLDLTVYPYLPRASVAMTSAKAYLDLLTSVSP